MARLSPALRLLTLLALLALPGGTAAQRAEREPEPRGAGVRGAARAAAGAATYADEDCNGKYKNQAACEAVAACAWCFNECMFFRCDR